MSRVSLISGVQRRLAMAAAMRSFLCYIISVAVILVGSGVAATPPAGIPKFELAPGPLEMSERASPRRFINAVGEKRGLWGFEAGPIEGWVYPLKIFHGFQLDFQLEGSPRIYSGREIDRKS